mgnify:CR=1 FL=1
MNGDAKAFGASESGQSKPEADRLDDHDLEQVSGGMLYDRMTICHTCGGIRISNWQGHVGHNVETLNISNIR